MIRRVLATIAWVPLMVTVLVIAVITTLLVEMTSLMLPAVRWLAKQGDGE